MICLTSPASSEDAVVESLGDLWRALFQERQCGISGYKPHNDAKQRKTQEVGGKPFSNLRRDSRIWNTHALNSEESVESE